MLISKLYRVKLTEPGVGKYLKRWGRSSDPTSGRSSRIRRRCGPGWRRPGRRSARRRRPKAARSSSRIRSASAPTRSAAAPGANGAAPRSCGGPGTRSR
ncbi:hypothetical protein [Streptomyces avermitilis]